MNIQDEITQAVGQVGLRYMSTNLPLFLQAKVLQFAVENELDKAGLPAGVTPEQAALALIIARYFRMADSEKFGKFFEGD